MGSVALFLLLCLGASEAFLVPHSAIRHISVSSRTAGATRPLQPSLRAVKGVESFEGSFTLDPQVQATLEAYLAHPDMIQMVTQEAKCTGAAFTGYLFQPVPYSPGTRYGMPREYEEYHNNPDYAICNVPPLIMFKAKVFKPSRLCAIYRVEGLDPEERERVLAKRKTMKPSMTEQEEHDMVEDKGIMTTTTTSSSTSAPSGDRASEGTGWSAVGEAMRSAIHFNSLEEGDDDADLDAMIV